MCDTADLHKFGIQRYVRTQALAANLDIKTYDVGNLNVAAQGISVTSAVGELWVEYDIELITPNSAAFVANLQSEIISAGGGSVSATEIFGAVPTFGGNVNIATAGATNTITFNQVGQYLVDFQFIGTMTSDTFGGTAASVAQFSGTVASGSTASATCRVNITAPGQTLTNTIGGGTVTGCVCRIAPYTYANA